MGFALQSQRLVFCGVLFLFSVFLSLPQAYAQAITIAAIVNDEAITNDDVNARVRLMLLGTSEMPPPEVMTRLRNEMLQRMIDEKIEMQEAEHLNITVEDSEIDTELARLAEQNKVPANQMEAFFQSKGVPITTLRDQVKASIAWGKVVQRNIRPRIVVSDDEVDAEIKRLKARAGEKEFLVADIFLPVDKTNNEDNVRILGQHLVEQMAKGVRFSVLARQFSQASSAAKGGDLGWVHVSQLDPALQNIIRSMVDGTVSQPVRTQDGFHIVMRRATREGSLSESEAGDKPTPAEEVLNLRQVLYETRSAANVKEIETDRSHVKSCSDMENLAAQHGDKTRGILGDRKLDDLPVAMQPVLKSLDENVPSPLMKNGQGVLFVMICHREKISPAGEVDRKAITNMLGAQKLELQAKGYLRNLRQEAFVELR